MRTEFRIILAIIVAAIPLTSFGGEKACVEAIASFHAIPEVQLWQKLRQDPENVVCLKNVPSRYQQHPNFIRLVYDPDRGLINPKTIREAMAAIVATENNIVVGPIIRAPAESSGDFIDGNGDLLDIKLPSSPRTPGALAMDPQHWREEAMKKLIRDPLNLKTGRTTKIKVIFDVTWITEEDEQKLKTFLQKNIPEDLYKYVYYVELPEPIRRLRNK